LYVAPLLLGERARPLFDGLRIDAMAQRLAMRIVETRRVGDDVRLLLQPEHGNEPGTRPAAVEPPPELLAVALEK
jgi:diaminohydroxyphosphoribosylaminopyrimidine deaminase/5-amino-6-(5-phosphoribosylamino)uracil reductase